MEEEEAVRRIPHGEGDTLCTRSVGWKELRLNNNNQDRTYIFFMSIGVSLQINAVKVLCFKHWADQQWKSWGLIVSRGLCYMSKDRW